MTPIEVAVARNICRKREELGITRKALCARLGINHSQVSNWESGKYLPAAWSLCLLADEFGCTVDELLGRNGKG